MENDKSVLIKSDNSFVFPLPLLSNMPILEIYHFAVVSVGLAFVISSPVKKLII